MYCVLKLLFLFDNKYLSAWTSVALWLAGLMKKTAAGMFHHMTHFKIEVMSLCKAVSKILTHCRIHKIIFKKYHVKAFKQSFPMMYIKGGSTFGRSHSKRWFPPKKLFWRQFFGENCFSRPNYSLLTFYSVKHHWKALVKSFHMVFFKNYFMDPAMRQNFGDAYGQIL